MHRRMSATSTPIPNAVVQKSILHTPPLENDSIIYFLLSLEWYMAKRRDLVLGIAPIGS